MAGAVVIGRNEGERLVGCLRSVAAACDPVIYVDSGSADDSVARAGELGTQVVELDLSIPFSAARARNAGLERLRELAPEEPFVQFVDGDCELVAGWPERAERALREDPSLMVVCGRRRERDPSASLYNRLCDLEWDTPVGAAEACGGDAMMRIEALHAVGGFEPSIIAGEEPELCLRLRRAGGRVERLDAEMTLHDADLDRFAAWWIRVRRGGHAAADGWLRHGRSAERFMVRRVRSALVWGLLLPGLAVAAAPATSGASLLGGSLLWTVQALRIARAARARGRSARDARLEGFFLVLGKPAEASGVLQCVARRWLGRPAQLIEYKGSVR